MIQNLKNVVNTDWVMFYIRVFLLFMCGYCCYGSSDAQLFDWLPNTDWISWPDLPQWPSKPDAPSSLGLPESPSKLDLQSLKKLDQIPDFFPLLFIVTPTKDQTVDQTRHTAID